MKFKKVLKKVIYGMQLAFVTFLFTMFLYALCVVSHTEVPNTIIKAMGILYMTFSFIIGILADNTVEGKLINEGN